MCQNSKKDIVFLSVALFLLGILSVAYHHHDNSFPFRICYFCKVKTTFSGSFGKIKTDSSADVAFISPFSIAVFFRPVGILSECTFVRADSRIAFPYFNKAPPFAV